MRTAFVPAVSAALPAVAVALTALSAALPVSAAGGAAAQQPGAEQVSITGTVLDAVTGAPIPNVTAMLHGPGFRLRTDAAGRFTFSRVPVGDYRLELSHPGYQTSVGDFTVMRAGAFVAELMPVAAVDDELVTGVIGVLSDAEGGGSIQGATVRVVGAGGGTLTDQRGEFSLTDVPAGTLAVEFSALGYVTRTDTVRVMPGRVTNVRVGLSADPVRLDPIEVTVERRETALQGVGFYRRVSDGFGEFIDREAIEQRAPAQMTDLFRRVVGADVRSGADGPFRRFVMLRAGRAEDCFPRVLLDGIVVHPGGDEPAAIDDLIDPEAVSGIEVYPSSTGLPMQYSGTDASCGVILIWTRR